MDADSVMRAAAMQHLQTLTQRRAELAQAINAVSMEMGQIEEALKEAAVRDEPIETSALKAVP